MNITLIDKKELPATYAGLTYSFHVKGNHFYFELNKGGEFGVGNYFLGFKLIMNDQLIKEGRIRWFSHRAFFSANYRYIFLPQQDVYEVYDTHQHQFFRFDNQQIDKGIWTIYLLNQFSHDERFLLLVHPQGYQLIDLETGKLHTDDRSGKYLNVHFGPDGLLWTDIVTKDRQQLTRTNYYTGEKQYTDLPLPSQLFDFGTIDYQAVKQTATWCLWHEGAYRNSSFLNTWQLVSPDFGNIYMTSIPTGTTWQSEGNEMINYEVLEQYAKVM